MVDNVAVVDRGTGEYAGRSKPSLSRPHIVNSNIYSIDVTNKFLSAAYCLPAGELIKDEHFTLFESVGALEIGDPKMDSGCGDDDGEPDFDVTQALSPPEVLWLMDELLCREAAWQAGYPLSQTLFTSYHIDSLLWPDPISLSEAHFGGRRFEKATDSLSQVFFRAYCLGVIKCCDMVLLMITSQHYYEEEDFATQLFNRQLLRRFAPASVIEIMGQAIRWLSAAEIDDSFKQDLHVWMELRILMLEALIQHSTTPPSPGNIRSHHLEAISNQVTQRSVVKNAFSPKLQQRFASNVPPRPMVSLNAEQTFEFWHQAIQDFSSIFAIRASNHSSDLETSLLTFARRDPQPCVYIRGLMQLFLTQTDLVCGRRPLIDHLWEDLRSTSLASSPLLKYCVTQQQLPSDNGDLVLEYLDTFLQKIERSYLNIFRTLCLNRSRTRRSLCHAVLEWDEIQMEAEELDEELQKLVGEKPCSRDIGAKASFSFPVSSWTYDAKLKQVLWIVQSGFELSVYAPYELGTMYWYLAYVCETHLAHLERITFFVSNQERQLSMSMGSTPLDPSIRQEYHATMQLLQRYYGRLKATEAFARCLHSMYIVLQRNEHFQQPTSTYSSNQWRHDLRMRPVLSLSVPELPGHNDMQAQSEAGNQSDEVLLTQASTYADAAKRSWEAVLRAGWNAYPLVEELSRESQIVGNLWSEEIRSTIRAAIDASVVIDEMKHLTSVGADKNALRTLRVTLPSKRDQGHRHSSWLVPQISV